jgi:methyl-accepting chemotaxis protein
MTIVRRIRIAVGGLLLLVLAMTGMGIGATIWLQSWHSDYLKVAEGSQALANPALQEMLDGLGSRSTVTMIATAIVAVVAVAFGVAAMVFLGRTIGRQVRAAMGSIGSSVTELLAVASQVAAATAQTAAATNETTVTVEEVKQTATLALEKAGEASGLSQSVVESSKFGETSSHKNYSTFDQIRTDMEMVTESIDRLNEQAQSVGDIIATVNDLAEQSNLLSVNASIEAAKAGEHGKGFTVVAQEVKSLAGQSKQAVAQVRSILSEIQKASTIAVRVAEQAREAVEIGRGEAGQAIDGTRAEVDVASRAAEAALQIAATSRQQLAGIEQISQAIVSINEAGHQSVAGTRQVENEVKRLQGLALSLKGLVDVDQARATRRTGARATSA